MVQTYVTAATNLVFTGGFSTWLTAMGQQASLNTGGAARGEPGYDAGGWGVGGPLGALLGRALVLWGLVLGCSL